ncbi:MAG: lysylphosphatidylglycerol synthase transmembrane domain-containing protein [Rhodospirillales bacterium]
MLKTLLKVSFSILVIGYLASHADGEKLLGYLQRASLGALALAALIFFVSPAVQAIRWRAVVNILGAPFRYRDSLTNILIGLFFNQILPSTIGGDAIRMWRTYRSGIAADVAISSVLLDRIVALLALIVIVGVATPVMYTLYGDHPELAVAPAFVALGIAGFVVLFVLDRLPRNWKTWRPVRAMAQLSASARIVMLRPANTCKTLGISIAIHTLSVTGVFTITQALALDVRFIDCLLLVPPVILFSVLPISVAGWGVREGVMITAFAIIGVEYDAAFTVSVLFGLGVMSAGIPGAILWVTSKDADNGERFDADKIRRFFSRDRSTAGDTGGDAA